MCKLGARIVALRSQVCQCISDVLTLTLPVRIRTPSLQLIRWVCKFGRADAVSMLFDDGRVDVTVNEQEAFRQACAQGHAAVVRLLLGLDCVDPSTEDNYAVKLAASNGHSDVLALLLADVCPRARVYAWLFSVHSLGCDFCAPIARTKYIMNHA